MSRLWGMRMGWTSTWAGLIGATGDFLVDCDNGTDPTSLDRIKGKIESMLYQTRGIRTAEVNQ